jgi:hypothetical protein
MSISTTEPFGEAFHGDGEQDRATARIASPATVVDGNWRGASTGPSPASDTTACSPTPARNAVLANATSPTVPPASPNPAAAQGFESLRIRAVVPAEQRYP